MHTHFSNQSVSDEKLIYELYPIQTHHCFDVLVQSEKPSVKKIDNLVFVPYAISVLNKCQKFRYFRESSTYSHI